jgi:hypothetical protein
VDVSELGSNLMVGVWQCATGTLLSRVKWCFEFPQSVLFCEFRLMHLCLVYGPCDIQCAGGTKILSNW